MSNKLVRPARFSAAAVAVLASLSFVSSGPEGSARVAGVEDTRVHAQQRESRFAPVQPQTVESSTTLVARSDRDKKVRVDGPRGGRVWTASELASHDVPQAAVDAYRAAARTLAATDPGCHLPWTLLAAIGRIESDHGRFAGSVLSTDGVTRPEIIGVQLNGKGPVAAISDTDDGRLDGDKAWDRAVGPMQFIPSTWAYSGRDGDGDGRSNPHDLDDAALAAGSYLCSGSASLLDDAAMDAAIFSYNPSDYYVDVVRAFEVGYRTGVFVIPSPPAPEDEAERKAEKAKEKAERKARQEAKQRAEERAQKKAEQRAEKRAEKKAKERAEEKADKNHGKGGDGKGAGPGGGAKPDPEETPRPKPRPKSKPSPVQLETVSGVMEACAGGWCVSGRTLDLGPGRSAAAAAHDYDGDGAVEANAAELTGLVGLQVVVQVEAGKAPSALYVLNARGGTWNYRFADGSFA